MQQCPNCDKVYDSSEYGKCPYCHEDDYGQKVNIVYDDEKGVALSLSDSEYEDFKKTHPDYH